MRPQITLTLAAFYALVSCTDSTSPRNETANTPVHLIIEAVTPKTIAGTPNSTVEDLPAIRVYDLFPKNVVKGVKVRFELSDPGGQRIRVSSPRM
jgi:hypothetical protein